MILANVGGRASIIVDGHAVDVEQASGGALGSDPMVLSDLANHDALRALAADADPSAWPELDPTRLGPPVPRPPKGLGVGLNYRTHAVGVRTGAADRAAPVRQDRELRLRSVRRHHRAGRTGRDRLRGGARDRVRSHLQGRHRGRRVVVPRRRHRAVRTSPTGASSSVPRSSSSRSPRPTTRSGRSGPSSSRPTTARPRRARARGPVERRGDAARPTPTT